MTGQSFYFDSDKDYYWILWVHPCASGAEIHQSYCKLLKRYHPAYIKTRRYAHWMNVINEAYLVLSNPILRAKYDLFRNKYLYLSQVLVGVFVGHPPGLTEPEPIKIKEKPSQSPPTRSDRSVPISPGVLIGLLPFFAIILVAYPALLDLMIIVGIVAVLLFAGFELQKLIKSRL